MGSNRFQASSASDPGHRWPVAELTLMSAYGALQIAYELQRLALVDARADSAVAPTTERLEASSAWAADCWDERFRLLTLRFDGWLVAFVAGLVAGRTGGSPADVREAVAAVTKLAEGWEG